MKNTRWPSILAGIAVVVAGAWPQVISLVGNKRGLGYDLVRWVDYWPALIFAAVGILFIFVQNSKTSRRASVRKFIRYLHEKHFPQNEGQGLSDNHRITVLIPKQPNRVCILICKLYLKIRKDRRPRPQKYLKCLCRSDDVRSSKTWSIDPEIIECTGLAGKSFLQRVDPAVVDLPDCTNWESSSEEDKQCFCEQTFTPREIAKKLSWKSRSYHAVPVPGSDQEMCAVIVYESLKPDGLQAPESCKADGIFVFHLLN